MPSEAGEASYLPEGSRFRGDSFSRVKVKMKKVVLDLIAGGKANFKERIMDFIRREFEFNSEKDNLRKYFEHLGVPVRLYPRYNRFLDRCEYLNNRGMNADLAELYESIPHIPSSVFPQFSDHYDLKNLFPPTLLPDDGDSPGQFVPINFKTSSSQTKFLLAGLHSGGKSFFLENIVLLSILGQIGFELPAEGLVVPKYNRIFYYRNVQNSGSNSGKAERELGDIDCISRQAKAGDLLIFDEFLDSTTPEVATWLGPEILGGLQKKKATVFVSTHRGQDYKSLQMDGWTIMSPEHEIQSGRVVPSRKLKMGMPNEEINGRYVRERYQYIKRRR